MTIVLVIVALVLHMFGNQDGAEFLTRLALPMSIMEAAFILRRTITGIAAFSTLMRNEESAQKRGKGE